MEERVKRARATADKNSAYARSLEGRLETVLALIEERSKIEGAGSIRVEFLDADVVNLLKLHFEVRSAGVYNVAATGYVISWWWLEK